MFKFLKNKKGDGSTIPILFIIIVSFGSMLVIFSKQIDNNLISLQKSRYAKAVEMAVNTALATVELSSDKNAYGESSLEAISLGYTLNNKLQVDKNKMADVFTEVLFRNVQANSIQSQEQFKMFVPMLAVIQYDTISLTAYCDKTAWREYPLTYYDSAAGQYIYLTLGDKYYTVNSTDPDAWKVESNRTYHSILDSTNNPSNLTELTKNQYLQMAVQQSMNLFVNSYKLSHKYYNINLSGVTNMDFTGAVKDVTVFCMVEGIPVKSYFSNEPDRSFYTFKFGGASIKRVDQ